jgi:hypothetical protein
VGTACAVVATADDVVGGPYLPHSAQSKLEPTYVPTVCLTARGHQVPTTLHHCSTCARSEAGDLMTKLPTRWCLAPVNVCACMVPESCKHHWHHLLRRTCKYQHPTNWSANDRMIVSLIRATVHGVHACREAGLLVLAASSSAYDVRRCLALAAFHASNCDHLVTRQQTALWQDADTVPILGFAWEHEGQSTQRALSAVSR